MSTTLSPSYTFEPDAAASAPVTRAVRLVRAIGRVVVIVLCLLHAYASRHVVNPDGVSYLDVASAVGRGDIAASVNYYWSPLYSWLLAATAFVVPPGAYWDASVAHLANVVAFLLSLLAFEWLLSEVYRTRRTRRAELRERAREFVPDWLVLAVGYAAFVWVARYFIPLEKLTPDGLVAAVVYAAVALLVRLQREPNCEWAGPVLGAILGLGYLAKTVLLPVGLLVLLTLLVCVRWPRAYRAATVAGLLFLLIAGPYIGLLSWGKGRLTIGETGRLNHLWYVANEAQPRDFGMGPSLPAGVERLHDAPPVIACARPGAGSFPLWYDPSVYYEGKTAPMNLSVQAAASVEAARGFAWMFANRTGLLVPTLAVVALSVLAWFVSRRGWIGEWLWSLVGWGPLLLVGLGAIAMYTLTGIAQPRLAGPFLVLLLLALVAGQSVPVGAWATVRGPAACVPIGLCLTLTLLLALEGRAALTEYRQGEGVTSHPHWAVAETLRTVGVRPGDGIAVVGDEQQYYYARLAGAQVVALVPRKAADEFAAVQDRASVYAACAKAGARAMVTPTPTGDEPGWRRVVGTPYSVRSLAPGE
jgi:hypothetical protein